LILLVLGGVEGSALMVVGTVMEGGQEASAAALAEEASVAPVVDWASLHMLLRARVLSNSLRTHGIRTPCAG